MKYAAANLMLVLALSACSATQAPPPPPKITVDPPKHEPVAALPTGADILARQSAEVQEAIKAHQPSDSWPVDRTAERILFPFGQQPEPTIDCAPLRTTDIQLEAGETITDVAMGDTERWMATPAASGDPRNPVPHLAVKPQIPSIETNLTIYTTRHIYHLILRSRSHGVQEVEFYYPDDVIAAMKDADAAAAKAKQETTDSWLQSDGAGKGPAIDPAQLNFSYTISGPNVTWKPVRAFDDGSRIYVQMPSDMKSSEAPALLIEAGTGTQMVNYRVEGGYYVVDRLVDKAVLVSGVGREQDRVTISYAGGSR